MEIPISETYLTYLFSERIHENPEELPRKILEVVPGSREYQEDFILPLVGCLLVRSVIKLKFCLGNSNPKGHTNLGFDRYKMSIL